MEIDYHLLAHHRHVRAWLLQLEDTEHVDHLPVLLAGLRRHLFERALKDLLALGRQHRGLDNPAIDWSLSGVKGKRMQRGDVRSGVS
jgi:hypothetical protein